MKKLPCIECNTLHSIRELDADGFCDTCNNYDLEDCDTCGMDELDCECHDGLFDDDGLYGFEDEDFNDDTYNEEDDWDGDNGFDF